jgi:hypothetical protein
MSRIQLVTMPHWEGNRMWVWVCTWKWLHDNTSNNKALFCSPLTSTFIRAVMKAVVHDFKYTRYSRHVSLALLAPLLVDVSWLVFSVPRPATWPRRSFTSLLLHYAAHVRWEWLQYYLPENPKERVHLGDLSVDGP